jgi:hypothetical protein
MIMDVELREARRLAELYRKLRKGEGTLESTAAVQPLDSVDVKKALRNELAKADGKKGGDEPPRNQNASKAPRAEAPTAAAGAPSSGDSAAVAKAATDVMAAAERAMQKIETRNEETIDSFEFAALEAIVLVVGRPAVRYTNGRVQMPNADGENIRWSTLVATARREINELSASVGRVGLAHDGGADEPLATAWRFGDDLVVTNRHVAEALASRPDTAPSTWTLDAANSAVVDFTVTDEAKTSVRFPVAEIVYCADEEDIDLAIFRLEASGGRLPDPLELDWDPAALGADINGTFKGQEIYIVGHPYRLDGGSVIRSVFGKADGFKRWSPGLVVALSSPRPIFEHDCSTLGGNSGSCVLSASGHAVIGLHFAGLGVDRLSSIARANGALALSQLGTHRAAAILKDGHA